MRAPWKVQRIEPEVWAIVDADGETILTLGQYEYPEGEMVVEIVNGMVEALEQMVEACNPYGNKYQSPGRDPVQVAREALAKVRGEGADDG